MSFKIGQHYVCVLSSDNIKATPMLSIDKIETQMASDLSFNTAYHQIWAWKTQGCPHQADSGITKLGLGPENETAVLRCIIWWVNLAKQILVTKWLCIHALVD